MMEEFDYNVLLDINDKLTDISDTLEKLLEEQYRKKVHNENSNEEVTFKNK